MLLSRPLLVIATALATSATGVRAQETWPTPAAWTELDRTLLCATDVVVGVLPRSARDELEHAARRGGGYVRIPIQIEGVLRSVDDVPPTELTFFSAREGHPFDFHPSEPELRRCLGERRVLLLRRVGDRTFFADRFRNTSVLSEGRREEVDARLGLHARCAATEVTIEGNPHRRRVAELLDQLAAAGDDATAAWTELQALPPTALPLLVHALEDQRPIRDLRLPLVDTAPTGEPRLGFLTPASVRHAVVELLARLTGERLGAAERPTQAPNWGEIVARWRIYAHVVAGAQTLASSRR